MCRRRWVLGLRQVLWLFGLMGQMGVEALGHVLFQLKWLFRMLTAAQRLGRRGWQSFVSWAGCPSPREAVLCLGVWPLVRLMVLGFSHTPGPLHQLGSRAVVDEVERISPFCSSGSEEHKSITPGSIWFQHPPPLPHLGAEQLRIAKVVWCYASWMHLEPKSVRAVTIGVLIRG